MSVFRGLWRTHFYHEHCSDCCTKFPNNEHRFNHGREGDVESVLIDSNSSRQDCVDAVSAECLSKGTLVDTNENTLKRTLPFNEYVSVFANCTNALLGVSIFTTPWGYAKSGLLGTTSCISMLHIDLSFHLRVL